jgi:hypothetical protein
MLFVKGILQSGIIPRRVVTYTQTGDQSGADRELLELCRRSNVRVELNRSPDIDRDDPVLRMAISDGFDAGELHRLSRLHPALPAGILAHGDGPDSGVGRDRGAARTELLRTIRALGFPYEGAKTIMDGQLMVIREASLGEEVAFVIRDPGKLWRIEGRRALVVCGGGTLWIEDACDKNGAAVTFTQLRKRFLTPDTAWIAPYLELDT